MDNWTITTSNRSVNQFEVLYPKIIQNGPVSVKGDQMQELIVEPIRSLKVILSLETANHVSKINLHCTPFTYLLEVGWSKQLRS